MNTQFLDSVGTCIIPSSEISHHAHTKLNMKLTCKILLLVLLSILAQALSAAPVIYSITSDDLVLNNPNGTWGGDLIIAADQNVNLTVAYQFQENPGIIRGREATFSLQGLQVFDNTNGLASAFLTGGGSITLLYGGGGVMDSQSAATFESPGGSFFTDAVGEFGDVGDPLPTGSAFDKLIDNAFLPYIIARASDSSNDNISGVNGTSLLPANFTFQSRVVPIPAALWLFGSGLIGLIGIARRKKA